MIDYANQINVSEWGFLMVSLFAASLIFNLCLLMKINREHRLNSERMVTFTSECIRLLDRFPKIIAERLASELERDGISHIGVMLSEKNSGIGDEPEQSSGMNESKSLHRCNPQPSTDTDLMTVSLAPGVTLIIKKNFPGKVVS